MSRLPPTFLALCLCSLMGCGNLALTIGIGEDRRELEYTVVEEAAQRTRNRVAIIDVAGLMANARQAGILRDGENPVSIFHEKLERARRDNDVKAVILRLNTPGGTVTASDAMYREVLRFKQRSGKPVIALMMDVAASGGYYLACAADQIVAYPSTITGSIGVILQTVSVKQLLDRWGIRAEAFTSGPNKDTASPFATMSDEQRDILQSLVDDFYANFIDVVRTSRPRIPDDRFATVTDGRVFTGRQAHALGLVDHVGDLYDALQLAKEAAGIQHADLLLYHRPMNYVGSPYARTPATPATGTQVNLAQFNLPDNFTTGSAGFYYLWLPVQP